VCRFQNVNIAAHDNDVARYGAVNLNVTAHDNQVTIQDSAISDFNRATQDDHIAVFSLSISQSVIIASNNAVQRVASWRSQSRASRQYQ
jgi:hypothetical protein